MRKISILLAILCLGACLTPAAWASHKDREHLAQDIQEAREQKTYTAQDIYKRSEGFFGSTSKGLAQIIANAFSENGEPNAYIEGEEFSGSFFFGLSYGQGTLVMRDGRRMPIYWQGPSFGIDLGGNAVKTFVLVYHLDNPSQIYQRIPSVAGNAYVIGGFSISFQQSGQLILAPIRSGVGARLGASVGYLSYSRSKQWAPF